MTDRFQFFHSSAHKAPGKGAGEHVGNPATYAELARITDWRKMLSNFHECPFTYGGMTWRTIEHGFQGIKVGLQDPGLGATFTVNSGSPLGRADGKAARAAGGRKAPGKRGLVDLTPENVRKWDEMKALVMEDLARAKYMQCPEARRVLLLTGNAQLWHVVRAHKMRFVHLEHLRNELRRM